MPRSPSGSAEAPPPTIWTVGHGTRSTDELVTLLRNAGVETLIDVRRYPAGKRQPQFSRERLAADLAQRGIRYEWWGDALGGRRTATPGAEVRTGWRNPAFAAYSEYLDTPAAREAVARLEQRARTGERPAIMCAETVWWRCHRRLVADALVRDGIEVRHLVDRAPGRPHRSRG